MIVDIRVYTVISSKMFFSMVKDSVDCMLVSSCPRLLSLMDYYSCFLTYGGSPILEYKP